MTNRAASTDRAAASAAAPARAHGQAWHWWWNDSHRAALLERW
ncbi:MAG TPA: hypothetical protein VGC46_08840 [Allosphingosinicella sp.]